MKVLSTVGKLILAGAGPGDADLITLKLQKAIQCAEVIIADRLVNPEIIEQNVRKDTKIILAGKQGYQSDSFVQSEVNQLIQDYLQQGKVVLRLKGGDVAFFSNVLDELETAKMNGAAFEIIPGITAAAGASAYAGIPLTARGYAQGVQLITYNPNSYFSPEKWKCLAATSDTLVFYMSTKNIDHVAELLLRFNKPNGTPLAVIEQATTEHQHIHITTIGSCKVDFNGKQFVSPSLIIIGDVVKLHTQFQWFKSKQEAGSVFPSLTPKIEA